MYFKITYYLPNPFFSCLDIISDLEEVFFAVENTINKAKFFIFLDLVMANTTAEAIPMKDYVTTLDNKLRIHNYCFASKAWFLWGKTAKRKKIMAIPRVLLFLKSSRRRIAAATYLTKPCLCTGMKMFALIIHNVASIAHDALLVFLKGRSRIINLSSYCFLATWFSPSWIARLRSKWLLAS